MVDPDKVYFLRRVRWLRGLSFEELSMVAALLREERYEAGTTIIRQGEEGRQFFVLQTGEARVELLTKDGGRILSRIGPGDNFGESALVSGEPRGASVIAETPCVVLAMERDDFELVLRRSSSFAQGLLKSLGAWVCRQGGGDDHALTSPVAVTRIVGGTPDQRGALALSLGAAMGQDLNVSEIPVVWAGPESMPAWLSLLKPLETVEATLAQFATQGKRVVVVGGVEAQWQSETDYRVVIGTSVDARSLSGERAISVIEGPPQGPIDFSSVVCVGSFDSLIARCGQLPSHGAQRSQLLRLARVVSARRVGVALGGGGAWGLASVGVLRAFKRMELPIDMIAGTSAGAIVGAAFCAEGEAGLQRVLNAFRMRPRAVAQLMRGAILGFFLENEVKHLMESFLPDSKFHTLDIPFYSVAYSVSGGEERVLSQGDLVGAVAASNAMPFMLSPVKWGGQLLVDGGFCNNVPASAIYNRGADFIVGVDVIPNRIVSEGKKGALGLPLFRRLDTSMAAIYALLHEASKGYTYLADVIIEPDLAEFNWFNYNRSEEIADHAEAYVMDQLKGPLMDAFCSFNVSVT